jgi:hypothetical protein
MPTLESSPRVHSFIGIIIKIVHYICVRLGVCTLFACMRLGGCILFLCMRLGGCILFSCMSVINFTCAYIANWWFHGELNETIWKINNVWVSACPTKNYNFNYGVLYHHLEYISCKFFTQSVSKRFWIILSSFLLVLILKLLLLFSTRFFVQLIWHFHNFMVRGAEYVQFSHIWISLNKYSS